jgi:hypothetical protein
MAKSDDTDETDAQSNGHKDAEPITPEVEHSAMDVATQSMADPLQSLPDWMKTEVSYSDYGDSSLTINKRGCQVIADYLDLEINGEVLTSAEETDFEYAYHKCTVITDDGKEYVGHGVARADGNDQPEEAGWKLSMLAETRAFKRSVKLATGGGIRAFVEATNE